MLRDKAIYYHLQGKNCSQSIIYACEDYYGIKMGEKARKLFVTGTRGFGIGGMCNVAVACVMFFGVYFKDESVSRQAGLLFLSEFVEQMNYLDCNSLTKGYGDCQRLIENACNITESIISQLTN